MIHKKPPRVEVAKITGISSTLGGYYVFVIYLQCKNL